MLPVVAIKKFLLFFACLLLISIDYAVAQTEVPSKSGVSPKPENKTKVSPEVNNFNESRSPSDWKYDFYNESYDAVQYNGFVHQGRLRAHYSLLPTLSLYSGIYYSKDSSRDTGGLRYADDFVAPTFGALYKPWTFIGVFAEYRRLLRTVNNELPSSEDDPRYGVYAYYLYELPIILKPHLEFYGESVALSRFTTKPVTTAWLKLGSEQKLGTEHLTITPYVEFFVRESPNLIIGFDDQSWRAGGKLKLRYGNYSAQILSYRRFHSDQIPLGWESLIVLSAEGGLFSWK